MPTDDRIPVVMPEPGGLPQATSALPVAKVHFHAEDKIGFPGYSNVTYGLSITREVADDGLDGILEAAKEIKDAVENFMAEEREQVLKLRQDMVS